MAWPVLAGNVIPMQKRQLQAALGTIPDDPAAEQGVSLITAATQLESPGIGWPVATQLFGEQAVVVRSTAGVKTAQKVNAPLGRETGLRCSRFDPCCPLEACSE